jgi:hypothetical protein
MRFINYRIFFFTLIVVFASVIASADKSAEKYGRHGIAAVKKYFMPKIAMSDIRIAFCDKGRVNVQLKEAYESLVTPSLESSGDDIGREGYLPEEVSPYMEEFVFSRISEKKGDAYTLFFPNSLTSRRLNLTGLAFLGGDGLNGFLGILGEEGACPACTTSSRRAYAIAIPGVHHIKAETMPERRFSKDDLRIIEDTMIKATCLANARLEEARNIYCRYPDVRGVIALLRNCETGDQYMSALLNKDGAWQVFPIETRTGQMFPESKTKGNSIVYLNRAPTNCGYFMSNSEFFVLPDIDGDGASEVMVSSDIISILFSIEFYEDGSCTLKEVLSARFDN